MSAATSLTPAPPLRARISSTLIARSTDCTPPLPSAAFAERGLFVELLLMAQL